MDKNTEQKIKICVETVSSKTDINGNRYHYFNAIRLNDSAVAKGQISSESNTRYLFNQFFGGYGDIFDGYGHVLFFEKTIPIKEFNRNVKNYPYIKEENPDFKKNIIDQWDGNKTS